MKVEKIKLPINKLVAVLHRLAPLNAETIAECLQQDSSAWDQLSTQCHNFEEDKDSTLSSKQVADFYDAETKDQMEGVALQEMLDVSNPLSKKLNEYKHSEY